MHAGWLAGWHTHITSPYIRGPLHCDRLQRNKLSGCMEAIPIVPLSISVRNRRSSTVVFKKLKIGGGSVHLSSIKFLDGRFLSDPNDMYVMQPSVGVEWQAKGMGGLSNGYGRTHTTGKQPLYCVCLSLEGMFDAVASKVGLAHISLASNICFCTKPGMNFGVCCIMREEVELCAMEMNIFAWFVN